MLNPKDLPAQPLKPGPIGTAAMYLTFTAVVARTLAVKEIRPLLSWYLGLELVYILLFTVFIWRHELPRWLFHLYLGIQCALVLKMLSLCPDFDFVVVLFLILAYQVSLAFTGWNRWIWISFLVLLTAGSLIFFLGWIKGLALALTTMAAEIVLPAYVMVNHETELAQARSQQLLNELQDTHQQLQRYADQVEELAAIQERNRLASELHDTVSQLIFSINLTARSAQLLLERDPARVPQQLNLLQEMTSSALGQLRSLITQMRPPQQS